ncbi:MAG: prolyl oligopeptidase family serine peptidase [Bacteroidia bacterium]
MKIRNIFFVLLSSLGLNLFAQENLSYQKPSAEILTLADYERAPSVSMNAKKEYLIFSYRNTYKTLDDLNQEEMRLGGLRINPITNISSSITYVNNLRMRKINEKDIRDIKGLPSNAKLAYMSFSPDEKYMAFTHTTSNGVELWLLHLESATVKRICDATLNANLGSPFTWTADSKFLLCKNLPSNRASLIDPKKDLPKGPTVSNSDGSKSQNRTFQDLLKNKTDEINFENLLTSELNLIALDGTKTPFKKADMYIGESYSPDGKYLMITKLEKPFSYIVPLSRFPQKSYVFDQSGNEIKLVNDVPLNEIMPKGFSSVRKGKRNMAWRSDKAAELYFVEALDDGDQAKKVDFRDELFVWTAPFSDAPKSIFKTKQRFSGISWGTENLAIVSDMWYDTRNTITYVINPSNPNQPAKELYNRNYQDVYSDPGAFETKKNEWGRQILAIENNKLFLIGDGFTSKGQFPFIDELDINTFKTKRIYTSNIPNKKEDILSIEDFKKGMALVQIQSKTDFPNYYFRTYSSKAKPIQLTFFNNPFESIKNVSKELIHYKRKDGVELTGTLYLPANYDKTKKEKLPLLIWAYPTEYKDKNSAGQNTQNPNEFTFPNYGSFVYWVSKGYAVLDDAAFPIIGEGKTEPNDNFMEQLVWNAEAAIEAVNNMGYINPKKVAVGGHSYGAFMTANLLTHSNLFACGIARSGAYNRTLTPFGFQSEQRNYWDVPEVYNTMSPFMNAHKMKTPMLLVHGDADNNPGTFTLQTERYFQALKGLGAPVRMVLLPKESHGYAAKENILHLLWEQDQFLEKYLKR